MSSAMEILFRQALKTFSGRHGTAYKLCQRNFEKLKNLMDNITADDLNINENMLNFVENQSAPMCVINVYENQDLTIVVFLIKHGVTLPMHDHPGMHGLLKVISGTVKIDTFTTQIPPDQIAKFDEGIIGLKYPSMIVEKNHPACVLSPHERNFHEIYCLNGPAAFLDILSPPYELGLNHQGKSIRPCTFFRQIEEEQGSNNDGQLPVRVRLLASELPGFFYSTSLKYLGPPLR